MIEQDYKSQLPKAIGIIAFLTFLVLILIFFLALSSEEDGVIRDVMLKVPLLQDLVTEGKKNKIKNEVIKNNETVKTDNTSNQNLEIFDDGDSAPIVGLEKVIEENYNPGDFLSSKNEIIQGEILFKKLDLKKARDIFVKYQDSDYISNYYLAVLAAYEHDESTVNAYLLRMKELNASEDLELKSKELKKAFDEFHLYPGSTNDHFMVLLARSFINIGEVNLGIVKLKESLKLNPNYKDAFVLMGTAYMMLNDYKTAENYLTQALPTDRAEPNYYLGLSRFNQKKYQEAILAFREASELGYHPELDLKTKLTESLIAVGKYQEALDVCNRIIEINPLDPELYYNPIWINLNVLNKIEDALYYAELALNNNQSLALPYDYVGWVYLEASQYEMSKKYLEAALEIDPELSSVYYHLGRVYQGLSDLDTSNNYFRKAIEVNPNSKYANFARSELDKF